MIDVMLSLEKKVPVRAIAPLARNR